MKTAAIAATLALVLLGGAAAGQTSAVPSATDCAAQDGIEFVCGLIAPEDLVALPGERWIVTSTMAENAPGLMLIDVNARTAAPAPITRGQPAPPFDDCAQDAPIDGLNTQGLATETLTDGTLRVYAANHGGRESLEVFIVDQATDRPTMVWSGCLLMPAGVSANAVIPLGDGALAISKDRAPNDPNEYTRIFNGERTGAIFLWREQTGFEELARARFSGNNGVAVSGDGRWLFVAETGRRNVRRIPISGRGRIASARFDFRPDNLRWDGDGRLLVAGGYLEQNTFTEANGWAVARLDPASMRTVDIRRFPGLASFDDATTALPVAGRLWIGSFHGDRVAIVDR